MEQALSHALARHQLHGWILARQRTLSFTHS